MAREDSDEAFAASVLDGVPIFIAYVDTDLLVTVCNVAAAHAFGRRREDVIGRSIAELLGTDSRLTRTITKAVSSGMPSSTVFTSDAGEVSGRLRTFAAAFVPDLDDEGVVHGVFANAFDVSDQMVELRTATRFAESLSTILQAIAGLTDPLKLLDTMAAESLKAVGGDYSLVSVRSGASWVVTHQHGTGGEDRIGIDYLLDDRPAIQDAAHTGQIQYVEDALAHPRTNKSIMQRFEIRSFIAVPLSLRGETIGVFEIVFLDGPHLFDETTRIYLTNLAGAASLAYGRMMDFQHERRIADTLQAALLHLPGGVDGIRFASHYAAASDEADIGGDFFDVFEVDAGKVGITVGDVAGKGLSAAIVTSRVRDSLRLCAMDGLGAAECVTKTNRLLYRITPPEVFATLIFGVLSTTSGEFSYVCAAHPPGILQRADGSVELLEGSGSLVGAFMTLGFAERCVRLAPGDELVLYTDGLTEARRDGEMYGIERIVSYLQSRRRGTLESLVSEVFDDVREYTGNRLRDDVAMLAISLAVPPTPLAVAPATTE
jgi:GAF domain-containing protein